jgi:hypothetical protein
MIKSHENDDNHPTLGRTRSKEALAFISKRGEFNSTLRKKRCEFTKAIISEKLSKHPLGVGIYDLNNNLISKFRKNAERWLNIFKFIK